MEATIMELIGSIGLPGALCIMMMMQQEKMRSTIENNTKAVVSLIAIVQGGKSNVSE